MRNSPPHRGVETWDGGQGPGLPRFSKMDLEPSSAEPSLFPPEAGSAQGRGSSCSCQARAQSPKVSSPLQISVFRAYFLALCSAVSGHRGDIGRFGSFRSEQKENSFPKGNLVV